MARDLRSRWNHNIHYHRLVLDAVPAGAASALDVGTGDGLLARDLHQVVPAVTALDVDAEMIRAARQDPSGIDFRVGDVMTSDFPEPFDVVASVATVHHLGDPDHWLRRLADLTAPGGTLVVIGLARSTTPGDAVMDLFGAVAHQWRSRRDGFWQHNATTREPLHSYTEVRRAAAEMLPGMRWRRLPLFRYALVWTKAGRAVGGGHG